MQIDFISSVSFNVAEPQLMLKYKEKLEGDSKRGDFSQDPLNLPLNLKPKALDRIDHKSLIPLLIFHEKNSFQSLYDNTN